MRAFLTKGERNMALQSISREKRLQIVSQRLTGILESKFGGDERRMAECEDTDTHTLGSWLRGDRIPKCLYGIACEANVGELWLLGKSDDPTPPEWQGYGTSHGVEEVFYGE